MFTQECFIRKNSNNLRRKLRNIGYLDNTTINYNKKLIAILGDNYYTYKDYEHFCKLRSESYVSRCIDCGENEELFLAIASLRDDTDKGQLIRCAEDQNWFPLCTKDSIDEFFDYEFPNELYRKATVAELIEHFKK